jgi:integrase
VLKPGSIRGSSKINFTKKVIDGLPAPTTGRTYVYDSSTPGLALCITAAGTKTFYSYRKVNGKPERVRLGGKTRCWPQVTIEEARDEALRIAGKATDGNTPNNTRRAEKGLPTLKDVFDEFILAPTRTRAKRPKSAKTEKDYRYQFDKFLAHWAELRLSHITRDDVEKLHNSLGKSSGFYMANRVLALVKVLFNFAIAQGHPIINPAARLSPFEEISRERFLQPEELPKFFAAVDAEPSEKIRDFIYLALYTGQRKSNVQAMRWEDLDLDRKVWRIPQTKTGKHEVPLSAPAMEIILRRQEIKEGDYVLPGRHGDGHLQDPMRQWRDILTKAGVKDLKIHDLRRSPGSWQTAAGASTQVVGKTLGHVRPETTAIYARVNLQTVRDSVDAAGAAMLATVAAAKAGAKPEKLKEVKGKRKHITLTEKPGE